MLSLAQVYGNSMSPTYKHGQIIVIRVSKRYAPQPNDVILFKHEITDGRGSSQIPCMLKRVLSVTNTGELYVLGDNAEQSADSRHFGLISPDSVIGKVVFPNRKRRHA